MKRIMYIVTLFSIIFGSCAKENDENASLRLNRALKEYQEILESEPNGWLLTYSFGLDAPSGEYTYLISFANGQATVSSDNSFTDHFSGAQIGYNNKIKSFYKLAVNEGISLSFDSYNSILHHFSTPTQELPNGYYADYEFNLKSVTKDKIMMTGKKYGKTLEMIPYKSKSSSDWAAYLKLKADCEQKIKSSFYYLIIDGKEIELKNVTRAIYIENEDGKANESYATYRIINNGIQFIQPLKISNYNLQNFIFEESSREKSVTRLICTDPGLSNIYIKLVVLPLNQNLSVKRWFIKESELSDKLKIKWAAAANGIEANGYKLDFGYLGPSHIDKYPGNSIIFSISDGVYASYMLNFIEDSNERIVSFTFNSNGNLGGTPFVQTYLKPLVEYFYQNSPYLITEEDNTINPNKMRLTSQQDANIWLRIIK